MHVKYQSKQWGFEDQDKIKNQEEHTENSDTAAFDLDVEKILDRY